MLYHSSLGDKLSITLLGMLHSYKVSKVTTKYHPLRNVLSIKSIKGDEQSITLENVISIYSIQGDKLSITLSGMLHL